MKEKEKVKVEKEKKKKHRGQRAKGWKVERGKGGELLQGGRDATGMKN